MVTFSMWCLKSPKTTCSFAVSPVCKMSKRFGVLQSKYVARIDGVDDDDEHKKRMMIETHKKKSPGAKEQDANMILVNQASKRKNRARNDASSLHDSPCRPRPILN